MRRVIASTAALALVAVFAPSAEASATCPIDTLCVWDDAGTMHAVGGSYNRNWNIDRPIVRVHSNQVSRTGHVRIWELPWHNGEVLVLPAQGSPVDIEPARKFESHIYGS